MSECKNQIVIIMKVKITKLSNAAIWEISGENNMCTMSSVINKAVVE